MYNSKSELIMAEEDNSELFKYSLFVKCPEPESLDYHLCPDNYFRTDMKPSFLSPLPFKLKVRLSTDKEVIKTAVNVVDGFTQTDQHVFFAPLELTESINMFYSEGNYCHVLKKTIILFYFSPDNRMLHCLLFKDFTPGNQMELFIKEILRVIP